MSIEQDCKPESLQAGNPRPDHQLDTCGLYCPEPVMMLHNKIRDIDSGQILEVVATDPATLRDIPKFCHFLGHELVAQQQSGKQYHYFLRKS